MTRTRSTSARGPLRRWLRGAWGVSAALCGGVLGCQTPDRLPSDMPAARPAPMVSSYAPAAGSPSDERLTRVAFPSPDGDEPLAPPRKLPAAKPDGAVEAREIFTRPILPGPAQECPITLAGALQEAGAANPTIALADEAVRAALAERLQARALWLPTLTGGMNYHHHDGTLLASSGLIRSPDSQSFYIGAGARTLAAETVAFPGIRALFHVGDAIFEPRAAEQRLVERRFASAATRNDVLLAVVERYLALASAEQRGLALRQTAQEVGEIVRLTANFARAGQGREPDANRARAEGLLVRDQIERTEEEAAVAAADLAEVLGLDPSVRLRVDETGAEPLQLVPPDTDLEALVQTARANRPEVGASAAAIAERRTRVTQDRVRPLLPTISIGFSAGSFGGGSDLVGYRFGHSGGRMDFDAFAVWTLQNAGAGNFASVRIRQAELGEAVAEQQRVLDRIDREVAEAHAQVIASARQVEVATRAVKSAEEGYRLDLKRATNLEGRPIELLNSAKLLEAARLDAIRAAIDSTLAQFRLFVALGQPPLVPAVSGAVTSPGGPSSR